MRFRGKLQPWLGLLALVWLVRRYVWMPVIVVGVSMAPTLNPGVVGGVNKLAYLRHPPHRGDVIAIWTGHDIVVKRIIGLPGEQIASDNGTFSVNGIRLTEPYVGARGLMTIQAGQIATNCYVVAGDNRAETFIGIVEGSRILGRLQFFRSR